MQERQCQKMSSSAGYNNGGQDALTQTWWYQSRIHNQPTLPRRHESLGKISLLNQAEKADR